MNNNKNDFFLEEIKKSFIFVLNNEEGKDGSRSSKKVDELHGLIANHLQEFLGENYVVKTKLKTEKEEILKGRYFDKKVDIAIERVSDGKILAGIGVKSIISSYDKNKNNYFENMLGETANIRSNNIPYFQIIILPYTTPNFTNDKKISSFSVLTSDKLVLYKKLSEDNSLSFFHTPMKTLLVIVDYLPNFTKLTTKQEYQDFYIKANNENKLTVSTFNFRGVEFDSSLILNNYEFFLQKVAFLIKGFD